MGRVRAGLLVERHALDGASGERCGGCVCHATGGGVQQLVYRTGYL